MGDLVLGDRGGSPQPPHLGSLQGLGDGFLAALRGLRHRSLAAFLAMAGGRKEREATEVFWARVLGELCVQELRKKMKIRRNGIVNLALSCI